MRDPELAPGVQTEAQWKHEYELVKQYGDVKNLPALDDMMDTDLVADLYDGRRPDLAGEVTAPAADIGARRGVEVIRSVTKSFGADGARTPCSTTSA